MSTIPQKAILLAAGKGTRMRDLTDELPKPMIEVREKPILEHIVTGLRDQTGIREFFIVTGYRAEVVENYFGDGTKFGVSCAYGRQTVPDGTGKAPELGKDWVGSEPFLLSYGDILIQPEEYAGIVKSFNADGLISVRRTEDLRQGGAVVFDEKFLLEDLIEKPEPGTVCSPWYNAGIYIFPPELFQYTAKLQKSSRGEYELTDAVRDMARDGLRIQGYEIKSSWADVRDPEVLEALNRLPE